MSLEDLTPQEKAVFNAGKLMDELLRDPDPKIRRQAQRLAKAKKPELTFPELEQEDQLKQLREESEASVEKVRDEIRTNKAKAALQAESTKIEEAGLDVKTVREFMEAQGITNVDVVIELFQSRAALAEPSSPAYQPVKVPDLKPMWENPVAWREQEGLKVQAELRGRKPVRQVG